jgi:hypothetical protein
VLFFTDFAVGWRQSIVHPVADRLHASQIRKNSSEVIVAQVLELPERHYGIQLSRPHISGSYYFEEGPFIVVSDAGGIGGDIGAGHFSPGAFQMISAAKVEVIHRVMAATP